MKETSGVRSIEKAYAERISQTKFLTEAEERELGERILKGDDAARGALITAYLPFAQSEARKVWNRFSNKNKTSLEDILQHANLGLIGASKTFDYRKGRFATIALWWMKAEMMNMLTDLGAIHIPQRVRMNTAKLMRTEDTFMKKMKRPPTVQELVAESKVSEGDVKIALQSMQLSNTVSLDKKINSLSNEGPVSFGGVPPTFGDITPDRNKLTAEDILVARDELAQTKQRVLEIFKKVERRGTKREFEIFREIYGSPEHPHDRTSLEVAKSIGITVQRVRQLLSSAWGRLGYEGKIGNKQDPLSKEIERIEELKTLLGAVDEPSSSKK